MNDLKQELETVRERLEDIEQEVNARKNGLPEINGWKMVEEVGEFYHLTVYRDEAGDCWIEDSDGEAYCFGGNHSAPDLIDAIREANR